MARVNAEEYAAKWNKNLKGATEYIRKGIERVTESPMEKAAKAAEITLQKIIEAFSNGTWAAQLRRVSIDDWKKSALGKGLTRLASGVDAADASQREMAQQLLAAVDSAVAVVNKTPRGDLEANIGRMVTFSREMASRKLRRPGSR